MAYHEFIMTNKPKRKRKDGAGRKPSGPITNKRENFSTRITAETREALEVEMAASGHSLSQVAERMLTLGLASHLDRRHDDPLRAFSFLAGKLALCCQGVRRDGTWCDWNTDPSVFEAFRLAVIALLDHVRPIGEIDVSSEGPLIGQSPEQRAEHAFRSVLAACEGGRKSPSEVGSFSIRLTGDGFTPVGGEELHSTRVLSRKESAALSRTIYAFSDARRALKLRLARDD